MKQRETGEMGRLGRLGRLGRMGAAAVLAAAAGCVAPGSPEGRIEKNRAFFDNLPIEVQARIRGGQTDVGFSADETRLAMGEPRRKFLRRTEDGVTEVWIYTSVEQAYERQHVDFVGVPDGRGGRMTGGGYVNALREREVPLARVELRDGVVVAIETPAGEGR